MKDRIKQIRKANNITQTEFGEKLGVKGNTVTGWETGNRDPSDAIIKSICREFHIDETWLRHGVGEMQASESHVDKLTNFFADVLATAPDDRSAFIAALADLPPTFWPLVVEQAKKITANVKNKED